MDIIVDLDCAGSPVTRGHVKGNDDKFLKDVNSLLNVNNLVITLPGTIVNIVVVFAVFR